MGSTKYALRVLEGKLKGHIYDLPENSELFLGRGASFDIVIDEDMVSRRHAKILTFHDQIVLQDLNSTNGTSVNQQRIQGSQRLQLGDSLTVGTCVLELIIAPQQSGVNVGLKFEQTNTFGTSSSSEASASNPLGQAGPIPNVPTNNAAYGSMSGHSNIQNQPVQNQPVQNQPVQNQPMQNQPMQNQPMQNQPMQNQPVQNQPMLNQPIQNQPMQGGYSSFPGSGAPVQPNPHFIPNMSVSAIQQNNASFGGIPSISGTRPRMKSVVGVFPSAETADVLTMIERLIERRHDGVLAIFDPEEREGSVYFRGGRIYFATHEDPHRMIEVHTSPQEALVKLCCWSQGRYKVKNMNALPSFEQEINEDGRSLLERVRQTCVEMNQLRAQLPPLSQRLMLCQPLNPLLTALTQEQLYLLQLAINQYEVRAIIDCHPQGEKEGIKALLFLLEQGYLQG